MNREQAEKAIKHGLELLGPTSDIPIPAKLNEGIFYLRLILSGLAQGQLELRTTDKSEKSTPPQE